MKKAAFILMLTLVFSPIFSQTKFSVPSFQASTPYQRIVAQVNYIVLSEINYAKHMGQTVEELATHVGDLFETTWTVEKEFKSFAEGCLNNYYCFSPYGKVNILILMIKVVIY